MGRKQREKEKDSLRVKYSRTGTQEGMTSPWTKVNVHMYLYFSYAITKKSNTHTHKLLHVNEKETELYLHSRMWNAHKNDCFYFHRCAHLKHVRTHLYDIVDLHYANHFYRKKPKKKPTIAAIHSYPPRNKGGNYSGKKNVCWNESEEFRFKSNSLTWNLMNLNKNGSCLLWLLSDTLKCQAVVISDINEKLNINSARTVNNTKPLIRVWLYFFY